MTTTKPQNHNVVFYMIGAIALVVVVAAVWTYYQTHPLDGVIEQDGALDVNGTPLLQVPTAVNIEDALLDKNPEKAANAKEMNDHVLERISKEREYLETCLSDLSRRSKVDKFIWDSVVTFYGDGTTVTIQDHYSKNWPIDFSEKEQSCWNGIFIGYSFLSKMQETLVLNIPQKWTPNP